MVYLSVQVSSWSTRPDFAAQLGPNLCMMATGIYGSTSQVIQNQWPTFFLASPLNYVPSGLEVTCITACDCVVLFEFGVVYEEYETKELLKSN
jgi:hypothetical protein